MANAEATVTVEVVVIVFASRRHATTIRKRLTDVVGGAIASSSLARARMMSAARARTSAWALATASKFPLPYEGRFELAHKSKSGCLADIIILIKF